MDRYDQFFIMQINLSDYLMKRKVRTNIIYNNINTQNEPVPIGSEERRWNIFISL